MGASYKAKRLTHEHVKYLGPVQKQCCLSDLLSAYLVGA